ncbi:MAG: hypothetical protein ABL986_15485 [Vicinamibacterales bacterium]
MRSTRLRRVLALAIVAIASVSVERGLPAQSASLAQAPTFNRDVAPILYANCVTCHRPDGIAPMTLTNFAAAKAYATRIRDLTMSREMPPWYADPQHGQFKNARGLTQAQIDTLSRWAEGGAPEGTGAAPAAPTFPSNGGWDARMNRAPDLVLDLPFGEYELPASGEVPTFTVWMKLPLREDRFVQALEIKPSLRHAVHHSSLALATLPQGTRIGRGPVFSGGPTLDGVPVYADGRPFRAASGEEFGRPVLFYVPGGGFMQLPDGLAKRFRKDDYLAWGLHLISGGRVEKLRVQVGIWYTRRDPHHEVHTWTVNETLAIDGKPVTTDARGARVLPDIPPGVTNLPIVGSLKIEDDVTLYSLWPHMHYRGKDMTFVLTEPNGRQTTLLSVPRYNPHWQLTYELTKPLRIRRGSTITASGHYDNSSMNMHNPDPTSVVKFGPQGTDEMYIPFIEVAVEREDLRFERLAQP